MITVHSSVIYWLQEISDFTYLDLARIWFGTLIMQIPVNDGKWFNTLHTGVKTFGVSMRLNNLYIMYISHL